MTNSTESSDRPTPAPSVNARARGRLFARASRTPTRTAHTSPTPNPRIARMRTSLVAFASSALDRALSGERLTRDEWRCVLLLAIALYAVNVFVHAVFHAKRYPAYLETGKGRLVIVCRVLYGAPAGIAQALWICAWAAFWEILRSPLWRPRRAHHGDVGARRGRRRTPVVHDGHASVAMCGGGFRTWYHIGVYHGLYQTFGAEALEKVHWAGSSVGALMAAIAASGVDPDIVWAHIPDIAALHRDRWMRNLTTVGSKCRFLLDDVLPEDAHERCTGRCFISITSLLPTPHNVILTEFESKDQLIDAVIASTYIPVWTFPGVCLHQGMVCVDGGVTNNLASLSSETLRIGLDPEDATDWGATLIPSAPRRRIDTFIPADDSGLTQMYECGKRDIARWLTTAEGKRFSAKLREKSPSSK